VSDLTRLQVRNFRALKHLDLKPDRKANLIRGHNGAGKTSLLESIFLLSRARFWTEKRAFAERSSHGRCRC